MKDTSSEKSDRKHPYERWVEAEGIPVVKGYYVEDLYKVSVEAWQRKGGLGAFINLVGDEEAIDAYVCEIPPGRSLKPQKHLYEEVIFVLSGQGATTIWTEGGAKQTFEWHDGSVFSIPLNIRHQHFNGQGDKPARYVATTSAPIVMNLFNNMDFIFNNNFSFGDRYQGEQDYFTNQGTLRDDVRGRKVWWVNFIPDVRNVKLYDWHARGAGGTNIMLKLANNTMEEHISEFPVGTYKKAHRHGPGAHVTILSGTGYSLMWREGQPRMKIDWHVGSLLVPPSEWFHQHFNTGIEPARYLALRTARSVGKRDFEVDKSIKVGGDQIEYEDEDPEIRKLYEQELAKKGLKIKMPPVARK